MKPASLPPPRAKRRICFVTGTRAEFGLMRSVLRSISDSKSLQLQIVVTGMHLDRNRGRSIEHIREEGWTIDAVVPWKTNDSPAAGTGHAIAGLARIFQAIKPDLVLVVGDRVEAFAGAVAAHLSGIAVAHVHGGDRALGQVDDCLRHAITKLAHLHFAATAQSARRIRKLGEDAWRIHRVGAPGIDGIIQLAATPAEINARFPSLATGQFALLVLHPVDADETLEFDRAAMILRALLEASLDQIVIIYPNNDPGSAGIVRCWREADANRRLIRCKDLTRPLFLGLLREAAFLIGNSSSGIIEAASFGTLVVDVGPRQSGRERSRNVHHAAYRLNDLRAVIRRVWPRGGHRRRDTSNVYGGSGAGGKIAAILTRVKLDECLKRKIIAY